MAFTLVTSGGSNDLLQISKVIDCFHFSNLRQLLTVTVYLLGFIKHCRDQINSSVPGQRALVEEISEAERHWIRCIQHKNFQEEIRYLQTNRPPKPILYDQFGLFMDHNQVVRCRGRLNNSTKNPILLPHSHWLLITHVHVRMKHGGV